MWLLVVVVMQLQVTGVIAQFEDQKACDAVMDVLQKEGKAFNQNVQVLCVSEEEYNKSDPDKKEEQKPEEPRPPLPDEL